MSFLEECKKVEPGYNGMRPYQVEEEIDGVKIVENEMLGSGRWSTHSRAVLQKGNEFVALDYEEPATEYQEGGDFDYEFYVVEPYDIVVTKFRRVK